MHLFFFARGKIEKISLFEAHASTLYFEWKRENIKTKQPANKLVQAALRKSVLGAYELIFPRESLAEVLAILGATEENTGAFTKPDYWVHKLKLSVLRKIFGVNRISKKVYDQAKEIKTTISLKDSTRGLADCKGIVSIHIIGTAEDKTEVTGEILQEML